MYSGIIIADFIISTQMPKILEIWEWMLTLVEHCVVGVATACACDGYNSGSERKKCIGCGHPPGKHANLSTNLVGSTPLASSSEVSSTSAAASNYSASHSNRAIFTSSKYQCQYPDCQKYIDFDPNSGTQRHSTVKNLQRSVYRKCWFPEWICFWKNIYFSRCGLCDTTLHVYVLVFGDLRPFLQLSNALINFVLPTHHFYMFTGGNPTCFSVLHGEKWYLPWGFPMQLSDTMIKQFCIPPPPLFITK